jgi:hypothetical protein
LHGRRGVKKPEMQDPLETIVEVIIRIVIGLKTSCTTSYASLQSILTFEPKTLKYKFLGLNIVSNPSLTLVALFRL